MDKVIPASGSGADFVSELRREHLARLGKLVKDRAERNFCQTFTKGAHLSWVRRASVLRQERKHALEHPFDLLKEEQVSANALVYVPTV